MQISTPFCYIWAVGPPNRLSWIPLINQILGKCIYNICICLPLRYFKQQVSWDQSTVKIADEVPRDDISTINTVHFTAKLDKLFKENHEMDPTLR